MKKTTPEVFELVPYSLETAIIEGLKAKYLGVTITPDDKASYAMVMGGLRECREIRGDVDAWHKERKELINKAGKHYDSERRRVHDLIAPVEDHLKSIREAEDTRKASIEKTRVDTIRGKILAIQNLTTTLAGLSSNDIKLLIDRAESSDMSVEIFMEFTPQANEAKEAFLVAARDALATRIRLEEEDAARKVEAARQEKVRKELAEAQAKLDAERRAQAEEKRMIKEAQAKLDADKKAEQDRKDREEFERKAKEKAEADARAKVEREEAERKAREYADGLAKAEREAREAVEKARKEALRPDKEKLIAYADALLFVVLPDVGNDVAKEILATAQKKVKALATEIKKRAKDL